nr:uncharacterized protein LOC128702407 [Cherax quadricarinatus]
MTANIRNCLTRCSLLLVVLLGAALVDAKPPPYDYDYYQYDPSPYLDSGVYQRPYRERHHHQPVYSGIPSHRHSYDSQYYQGYLVPSQDLYSNVAANVKRTFLDIMRRPHLVL